MGPDCRYGCRVTYGARLSIWHQSSLEDDVWSTLLKKPSSTHAHASCFPMLKLISKVDMMYTRPLMSCRNVACDVERPLWGMTLAWTCLNHRLCK